MPRKKTNAQAQEEVLAMTGQSSVMTVSEQASMLKDTIAAQIVSQCKAAYQYKQPRVEAWLANIDLYNLKKEKDLGAGRFDYPLPIMSGFVDTLHAKIDDEPYIIFKPRKYSDKNKAKKITSAWEFHSTLDCSDWADVDRDVKKLAIFTGRGIYLTFCESDPEFKHYFEAVDPFDYLADPMGGGDLRNHSFGFQDNIMRTKWDLQMSKVYDRGQIMKLVSSYSQNDGLSKNIIQYRQKLNRLASIGLDGSRFRDYTGDAQYRIAQGWTVHKGIAYWAVIDLESGIWLRIEPLNDIFSSRDKKGTNPFVSWATHRDSFNFWSKAPSDDIRPVAMASRRVFNEAMYNINKRNSGQRAYDPEIFDEPELLEWRPDGTVPATVPAGKRINDGIYEFHTEDNTAITVNLMSFLDNFTGQKTGITSGSQGQAQQNVKVGVYFGDLKQAADRLGLTNKYYAKAWKQAADRYQWALWDHFPQKLMIPIIGQDGNDWDELKKEDVEPEFAIDVKSGTLETQADEVKKKTKAEAIMGLSLDPLLSRFVNPRIIVEERLRNAGWAEEDIKRMMDLNNIGDEDSIINAEQAIQDILIGKEPRMYRSASLIFLQRILDFLNDNEMSMQIEAHFFAYFSKMQLVVEKNMARRKMFGGPTVMLPNTMSPMAPNAPMTGVTPPTAPIDTPSNPTLPTANLTQ